MHFKMITLFLIFFCKCSDGLIYYLNETEFSRMPAIYHMDDYQGCLQQPRALYCTVHFNLVSDTPSDLLYMIQEYSKRTTHFNHTKLRYSICVTTTSNINSKCQRKANTSEVPSSLLEGCLNETIYDEYELRTRVTSHDCYGVSDKRINIDANDVIMAIFLIAILILNAVGTFRELYSKKGACQDRSLLSCFAVNRNWRTLTSTTIHPDPRMKRLTGIHCLKCIILSGVIMAHTAWPFLVTAKNTHDLELAYYSIPQYILLNGSIVLQTYLVISAFLLVYKLELMSEKRDIKWNVIPMGILLRYIRLTPAFAVVTALLATWLKFVGRGPLWAVSGGLEMAACRSQWWASLIYVNNYIKNSQCMVHTWYVAVDMQLYSLALVLYALLRNSKRRGVVLTVLFIMSLIIPAIHIYYQDLDAILMVVPEQAQTLFAMDPTFNEVYKTGHTNMASYIAGMSLGYLVYRWQKANIDINKYKKYRVMYWSVLPLILGVIMSGGVFYRDAPRDPLYIRVLYGAISKPLFGVLIAVFICGMIFKIESVYRYIFEWRGWIIPSRLSYSMFLVHFSFFRIYVSIATSLNTIGPYDGLITFACVFMASLTAAIPLWLFLEAPFLEITKLRHSAKSDPEQKTDHTLENKTV